MYILPISNNKPSTNFKAVYPVIHRIAEANGNYTPELTIKIAQELNERIIKILNTNTCIIQKKVKDLTQEISNITQEILKAKTSKRKESKEKFLGKLNEDLTKYRLMQRVQTYIARCDSDYAKNPIARGFYSYESGYENGNFNSIAYIATGDDALYLENLGKQIGIARSQGKMLEEKTARINYRKNGMKYVSDRSKLFKMPTKEQAELHIKMDITKDINGKIIKYNIPDMKFFARNGVNNPFMISEWTKK